MSFVRANPALLQNCVAFEVRHDPVVKQKQFAFTGKLAEQSQGMIANPTGSERYLAVSGGHTSQFMKAINFNCKSPIENLVGGDGCLGPHLFKDDVELFKMSSGWVWTIVSSLVVKSSPALPSLVEAACNSTNRSFAALSELELTKAIMNTVSTSGDIKFDFEKLTEDLCHGGSLQKYCRILGRFVQLCSGKVHAYIFCTKFQFVKPYGLSSWLKHSVLLILSVSQASWLRKWVYPNPLLDAFRVYSNIELPRAHH